MGLSLDPLKICMRGHPKFDPLKVSMKNDRKILNHNIMSYILLQVIIIREREKVYFPQYNKIYVALNDSNKTKWRVAGKAQGPS